MKIEELIESGKTLREIAEALRDRYEQHSDWVEEFVKITEDTLSASIQDNEHEIDLLELYEFLRKDLGVRRFSYGYIYMIGVHDSDFIQVDIW